MDEWLSQHLVCPVDGTPLAKVGGQLRSAAGRTYPIVDDVPVLLRDDMPYTMALCQQSLRRALSDPSVVDQRAPELYLESLGISEEQKAGVVAMYRRSDNTVDPVVAHLIAATSGHAYAHLVGALASYPIPELRLPDSRGQRLLDVGCSWGRWSIAAALKGYQVVGIDPSLGAVMAARRVVREMGLECAFVVGDARWLPFASGVFDSVFSYSVLQHFPPEAARIAIADVARVLRTDGESLIQMPNAVGVRSLQHQARRAFREARDFEVRYYGVSELVALFNQSIGPSQVEVDCFFGLGLQAADISFMSFPLAAVVKVSEVLRHIAQVVKPLTYLADSVYLRSRRR